MPDTTATATTMTRRAPRWTRVGVWVMFAVVGIGSLIASGSLDSRENLAGPGGDAAQVYAADGTTTSSGHTINQAAVNKVIAYYTNGCDNEQRPGWVDESAGGVCDPYAMLPTNRWEGASGLFASYGWLDIPETAQNGFASMLFSAAGLIWAAVFWFVEIAVGFNVFTGQVMQQVNNFFTHFAGVFIGGGLIVIPALVALLYAISRALRGDATGMLTVILGAIMPVALLIGLTNFSAPDDGDPDAYKSRPGSPTWIAQQGVFIVDDVAGQIATGFGAMPDTVSADAAYAEVTPSCVAYTAALRHGFDQWRANTSSADTAAGGAVTSLSALWERAYLSQWIDAQYGGSRAGSRIWCHQLEAQAGTLRAVQVEVGNAAGYPSIDGKDAAQLDALTEEDDTLMWEVKQASGLLDAETMGLTPQGQQKSTLIAEQAGEDHDSSARRDPYQAIDEGGKGYQASLFMWAGCQYHDGQMKAQTAWHHAGELGNEHCQAWWYGGLKPGQGDGGKHPLLEWDGMGSLRSKTSGTLTHGAVASTDIGGQTAPFDPETSDNLSDVRELVKAFRGDNHSQRIVAGLIAVITALAYGYVIGGLAIGGLLAKIGVAVMLMLLPGTLMLLAFPNKGQGRNPAGLRLARMTIGFLAASAFLTVALVLMVSMITIIESLLGAFSGSFLSIFTPLIALFLMRFIFKRAGLGDLANFRGQLGLTAAAGAAVAAKDGRASVDARRAARKAENLPSRREAVDRTKNQLSKRWEQAKRAGGMLDSAGGWVGRTASNAADATKRLASSRSRAERTADKSIETLNSSLQPTDPNATDRNSRTLGQLGAVAGAAKALAAADTAGRIGGGNAGASAWAAKNGAADAASRNAKRLGAQDRRDLIGANRDQARAALRGKTNAEERSAALAALMNERADRLRAGSQVERDAAGNVLRDAQGNPIYGFARTDADGNAVAIGAGEAGYDPTTGRVKDGVSVLTTPRRNMSELEAGAARDVVAEQLGLDSNQVLGSTDGLPPVPALRIATESDATRIPVAASLDTTIDLARDAVHWLPDEFKSRLNAADLSESARNRAVHQLMVAAGGIDADTMQRVDFPSLHGIDLDTAAGVAELEKHLDGKPSAFDDLTASVSGVEFSRILGDARRYDLASGGGQTYSARQVPVLLQAREAKVAEARTTISALDGYRAQVSQVASIGERLDAAAVDGGEPSAQLVAQYNSAVHRLGVMIPDVVKTIAAAKGDAAVLTQIDLVTTKAATGRFTTNDVEVIENAVNGFDAGDVKLLETLEAAAADSPQSFVSALEAAIDDTLLATADTVLHAPQIDVSAVTSAPRAAKLVSQRSTAVPKVAVASRRVIARQTGGDPKRQLADLIDALGRDAVSERERQYAELLRDRVEAGDDVRALVDEAYASGHAEMAEQLEKAARSR